MGRPVGSCDKAWVSSVVSIAEGADEAVKFARFSDTRYQEVM